MVSIYIIYVSEIPYHHEGGASRSAKTLLEQLVKRGHKCLSISRIPGERHVHIEGVHCLRTAVPEDWLSNLLKHDALAKDKVVLTQHVQAPWVYDLANRHNVPIIMRVPSWEMFCNDVNKFATCTWNCTERRCSSKSDFRTIFQKTSAIMSISDYVAKVVKSFYDLDSTVIPPFVDRSQYLIDERQRKFVTMIRGHTAKGAEFFVDLAKSMPNVPFALAGGCDPNIKQLAGEAPNILRIKHDADIRPVYAQTAIYLAPVIWAEPFGRTLVEAMMNGIPVIGSDRGALPEVLGDAGIILPLDQKAWKDNVEKLLTDETHYNNISAKCAARSLDPKFDIESLVTKFEDLCYSVTNTKTSTIKPIIKSVSAQRKTSTEAQKTVLFGPWIGEAGWEFMMWQSWCRKEAAKYKKAYVCSFPEMEYLYSDFAEFIPHDGTTRELWGPDKREMDFSKVNFTMPSDVEGQILPIWALDSHGEFICFGSNPITSYSCLVHARDIKSHGQAFKNYPAESWRDLATMLPEDTASIGTMSDLHVEGTTDLRGIPLEDLANYITGCRVMVGGSSGPMHFACLCNTPIVVWGPKMASGGSLEERYRNVWNPFKSPVEYITADDWRPDPKQIAAKAAKVLSASDTVELLPRILGHSLEHIIMSTGGYIRGAELDTLFTTADELNPATIVEIGACTGTSSTILGTVAKRHKGMLYSIELHPRAEWFVNMRRFGLVNSTKIIQGYSTRINVDKLPFKFIDYLLIDGDHSYEGAMNDYTFWAPLVRPGGRIAFHDCRSQAGVQRAILEITKKEADNLVHLVEVAGSIIKDGSELELGLTVFEKVR